MAEKSLQSTQNIKDETLIWYLYNATSDSYSNRPVKEPYEAHLLVTPPPPLPDPLHYLQSLSISQYAGKMYVPPPLLSRIKPQSVPVFQLCSVSAQNNNKYINAELSDTLEAITRHSFSNQIFFFCLVTRSSAWK